MIKSMTGFGRCEIIEGERKFTVELKGVNHRYLDANKVTIISCEYESNQLLDIDEATGSRIIEKCKAFLVNVTRNRDKNYRLRNS